ncbi:hypothetical protein [Streptomyces sp. NPDC054863]
MKRFSSDTRAQIAAIVDAVAADDLPRLDTLIETFVQHADLTDLFALRTALADALVCGDPPPDR